MVSTRLGRLLTVLVIGVCLQPHTEAGDAGVKQKKVIIKVPQIIKHIHHHHVKKVHVYEEEPKKEYHYGPFHHKQDTLTTTKVLGGWPSEYNGMSTDGEWNLPKTFDGWSNLFKKGFGGDSDGHDKNSVGKYEGGEAWKESDDSYGWKGSEDWENKWAGGKFSSGIGGISGGYESNIGGGYNDDSQVMYELPLGVSSSGKLGEVHQQNSLGSYGESSFEDGYGENYKLHKRENRGLQIGTHLNQFMDHETMRQPEIKHAYEPSEDNKQSEWIYVPTLRQSRNAANLGQMLLMQDADNSHLRTYLNGRSNGDWTSFNAE